MKTKILLITFSLMTYLAIGQKNIVSLSAYDFGIIPSGQTKNSEVVLKNFPRPKSITLPEDLLRSLYRKGSIARTINIYGQSLIIESAEALSNGKIELTLRREDGRDFYNIYPFLRAEITQQNTAKMPSL